MEVIEHHRRREPALARRPLPAWQRRLLHPAVAIGLLALALLLAVRSQPLELRGIGWTALCVGLFALLRLSEGQRRRLDRQVSVRTAEAQARSHWLDAVSELSPNGVLVFELDGEQGHRLVFTNPAFSQLFGLRPEELLGLSEAATDEWLAGLAPAGAVMPALAPGEATLQLAGPPPRVLRRSSREDRRQRVYYFRDVTHESEVERLKNEFLTTAAHELRTPLASVYGFSELLHRCQLPAERQAHLVGIVHRQAGVLKHLVDELLDLARLDARGAGDFETERHDLRRTVTEAIESVCPPPEDGDDTPCRIDWVPPADPLWVRADASKLRQVLVNGLSNALKYSAPPARVSLHCGPQAEAGREGVVLTIRDRGIGMSPAQCARAFERFYRADPSGHILGAGLGLAIAAEIVRHLGGQLTLDSRLGEGTTLRLWLPLAEPAEPAEALTS